MRGTRWTRRRRRRGWRGRRTRNRGDGPFWIALLAKADQYLEGTVGLDAECMVTIELDEGNEMDPEEEAWLEGEEDKE
jgi:hypothetical protein